MITLERGCVVFPPGGIKLVRSVLAYSTQTVTKLKLDVVNLRNNSRLSP